MSALFVECTIQKLIILSFEKVMVDSPKGCEGPRSSYTGQEGTTVYCEICLYEQGRTKKIAFLVPVLILNAGKYNDLLE